MPAANRNRTATAVETPLKEARPAVKLPAEKLAFHPVETTTRLPEFRVAQPITAVGVTPVVHSGKVDPSSPIGQRYAALGGAAALGQPFFDERPTPDGRGSYQAYDHGAIFYCPAFGAVFISSDLYTKWDSLAAQTTADGDNVRRAIGLPTQDAVQLAGSVQVAGFERGMIVIRHDGAAHVVYGAIGGHYRQLNDVHGFLGLPSTDEEAIPNGRRSRFDLGDIYWSSGSGAQEVHGGIRAKWESLGGVGGFLGYPLTDELPVTHGGAEIGRCQQFAGGWIYWSPSTGALEVHGDIRRGWIEKYGGPAGALGFPVSDETGSPGGARYSNFQRGCLVWRGSYDGMSCLTSMDVFLQSFNSKGQHTFAERHLGYPIWLYVYANARASTGQAISIRYPGSGHYGGPSAAPTQSLLQIPVVHGDLWIDVSFDGWDAATWGDVHLGTVTRRYTIDNQWGQGEDPDHWSGDFMAAYSLRPQTVIPAGADFRGTYFWKVVNFRTPELSHDQYAQTFYDVQEDESSTWHWFDALYYDNVYKHVAAGGNCFGMCLESMYAQYGRSLFPEPLHSVPDNAVSENQINIKHGYQAGAAMIDYFIGKFLAGQTHDPVRAFQESRESAARGDYPILTVTKDYFGSEAHAVRPYAWNNAGNPWTISIANPNDPAGVRDFPQEDVITIDPVHNSFRFVFDQNSNDLWCGDAWSGGRMFSMPYRLFAQRPRTPFWEIFFGALAAAGLVMLIIADAGETQQITDEQGRTFFEPGSAGAGRRLVADPAKRVPGLATAPIIRRKAVISGTAASTVLRSAGGRGVSVAAPAMPEVYYARRAPSESGSSLHLDVAGKGSGQYRWTAASPAIVASAVVSATGPADRVAIEGLGSTNHTVSLTPGAQGPAKEVALTVAGRPARSVEARTFEVTKLTASPGKAVKAQVHDGGRTLRIDNGGAPATFDIRVYAHRDPKASLVRSGVKLEANATATIRPTDWSAAMLARTNLDVTVQDRKGKVVRQEKI